MKRGKPYQQSVAPWSDRDGQSGLCNFGGGMLSWAPLR